MSGIGWLMEPLEQYFPLIVCLLLLAILVALVVIIVAFARMRTEPMIVDTTNLDTVLARIEQSAEHAANVSAVIGLVRQLDANPDALELIKNYPETVRAAAWLHHINLLGADLRYAQQRLSDAHQGKIRDFTRSNQQIVDEYQQKVDAIRTKLDAAIMVSGQSEARKVP